MVVMDRIYLLRASTRFLLVVFLVPALRGQEFLIITSKDTALEQLTEYQLKQIYLGKLDRLRGVSLTPVQLKKEDPARVRFEQVLFGDRFDLENYWLVQKLKAAARQPLTVGSWALLLAFVERNPGFIGYIEKPRLKNLQGFEVKVLTVAWEPDG